MNEPSPGLVGPVHIAELAAAAATNTALARAYAREQASGSARRTHMFNGRFENTYIDAGRLPELAPVADFALAMARRLLARDRLHFGFWFNEMAPGHKTSLHTHEEDDELLSAVYYITAPEHSGRLVLHDEDAELLVTPRPGMLVLFPPDLPHEVEANASDQTRLSVAFNFGPPRLAT